MRRSAHILPIIIFSQFTGTSLWFAGNAVVFDLQRAWGIGDAAIAYLTSAVQLGFIVGTLAFALLVIADRYSPRAVFFTCSVLGAGANLALLIAPPGLAALLLLRFATGFFLAGIYPVGMKIAAGWYRQGLGRALGYLVGALVLGTAFPHLLRASGTELPWQQVIVGVSLLALIGGACMFVLVPDGPQLPRGAAFRPRALLAIFRMPALRASAFGYFGHMWELYALWAFTPLLLLAYAEAQAITLNISLWSFAAIGVGALGCVAGGMISIRSGSARVAAALLAVSGICCLLSPLMFLAPPWLFLGFVLLWGLTVSSDSPQFSALNAANAPREYVGSILTLINSIGFLITVVSIQIIGGLSAWFDIQYLFWLLAPGPALGLWMLRPLLFPASKRSSAIDA